MLTKTEYAELSAKATNETSFYSSISQILEDPSVQAIIQMGIDALPFIFLDLAVNKCGCHWQMAVISTILAANNLPLIEIPEEFRGVVKEMVRIYIEYGREYHYI